MKHLLTLTFLFLTSFTSLVAQTVMLDSVTIVADRLEATISEQSKSITILTAEQIENLPLTSADDLLRYVAGVNHNSRGAFGVQSDFGLRGSTFAQVVVLLDGVRMNDPLTAHFNSSLPIPLSQIARVEVIRGAGSMAYGADAVGGIIHFHSKTFEGKSHEDGVQFHSQTALGEFDLFTNEMDIRYSSSKFTLAAGLRSRSADGKERDNPNYLLETFGAPKTSASFFDINTISLESRYALNDQWSLSVRGAYDERSFDAQHFYTRSSFDESYENTVSRWAQARLAHHGEKSSTQVDLGARSTSDYFLFNPLFAANSHLSRRFRVSADHRMTLKEGTQLSFGALASNRDIQSSDRGDHVDENVGIYVTAAYRMGEKTRINGGVRLENDSNFGTEILPQLGLSHHLGKVSLRAEANQAIRAGDYTERFISSEIPSLSPGRNLGNPDLLAEKSTNFSIGAIYTAKKGLSLSTDIFYRQGRELIDYLFTESSVISNADNLQDSASYFYASNLSEVDTYGAEFVLAYDVKLGANWTWNNSVAITILETEGSGEGEVSKYLADHPDLDIDWMSGLSYSTLTFNILLDYIQRQTDVVESIGGEIPADYLLLHPRIQWNVNEQIALFFQVHNIGDVDYQEVLGAQMPGRWMMGGLKTSF